MFLLSGILQFLKQSVADYVKAFDQSVHVSYIWIFRYFKFMKAKPAF